MRVKQPVGADLWTFDIGLRPWGVRMLLRLGRLLRKFDAALVVACFMLAATGGVAMAEEVNLFLNKYEPPGGQGNTAYNT